LRSIAVDDDDRAERRLQRLGEIDRDGGRCGSHRRARRRIALREVRVRERGRRDGRGNNDGSGIAADRERSKRHVLSVKNERAPRPARRTGSLPAHARSCRSRAIA
jgi:hypothetical protein